MSTMNAISGLFASSRRMDVISNNIANASTIGYKSGNPIFYDIFSNSLDYYNNIGLGVGISSIMQDFHGGKISETGRDLDIGITQNGFFRLIDDHGHVYYTRNGQFSIDQNDNIINLQGMHLTGLNTSCLNNQCYHISNLKPINIKHAHLFKSKATSQIIISAILNSNNISTKPNYDESNNNISDTRSYDTYLTVYDKNDGNESLQVSFNKNKEHNWEMRIQSYPMKENNQDKRIDVSFNLEFDKNGKLISNPHVSIEPKNEKYNRIDVNLTDIEETLNNRDSFSKCSQDGYTSGRLSNVDILSSGKIVGTYSNQQKKIIGQILLSQFINPETLKSESNNLWSTTSHTGKEIIKSADNINQGEFSPRCVETSNVDLNKELINMIMAQRDYQANAQSFKAQDKLLGTLINLS